jgi:hypothetical protein
MKSDDMVIVPFWVLSEGTIFRFDKFWWFKNTSYWSNSIGGNRSRGFRYEYVATLKKNLPLYLTDQIYKGN